MNTTKTFTDFANMVSRNAGRPVTFLACLVGVAAWALFGPAAGFSETWQLVVNTATTIVTFLMVFLIQNTQNRDNAAIQAKLDELIRVGKAKNDFIGIERLTDRELEEILAGFDDEVLSPRVREAIVQRSAKKKTVKHSKTAPRRLRAKDAQAVNRASSKNR